MTNPIPAVPMFALGRPGRGRGASVKRLMIQPPPTFARRPVDTRRKFAS